MPFIFQVRTSFPENTYAQADIQDLLHTLWPAQRNLIEQFFMTTEVKTRSLALPLSEYSTLGHFGERNNLWKSVAQELQIKNIDSLLQDHNINPDDIKLIASVNSTGLCVPSLEALLINQTELGLNASRMPLFGLGCLGGVAGLNRANDYLLGHPKDAALVLVTELCSLTFQLKDASVANLIGAALFGDGAGAVLMVGHDHPLATYSAFEILQSKSILYPNTEHYMGWKMVENGFEIELSSQIPELITESVGKDIAEFIHDCGLDRSAMEFFIAHPGGPKVLDALSEALEGRREDFRLSWQSLGEHGNLSSVSVIDVLERSMKRSDLKKGQNGLMLAMGPAFSLELSWVRKC